MLYLFDIDGTVISAYMETRNKRIENWKVLPGRREKLAELVAGGHTVALITNQGAVAFGYVTEGAVKAKLSQVRHELGIASCRCYVCFADVRATLPQYADPEQAARRKPSGAMLLEAMRDAGVGAADTLMVGDRPEDAQAAANAGVAFQWANDFFGDAEG